MKCIAAIIVLLLSVSAGVFLVYNMDISDVYVDVVTEAQTKVTRGISANALPAEALAFSDNIVEDPDVGVLYLPYDYSSPVPVCEPVDNSYFDRCVFIGDSRMLGLIKYNDIDPINYCSVGFSVGSYENAAFVRMKDKEYTVKEALRENDEFDAVYISTGLNELGWSIGRFSEKYRYMIEDIKQVAGDRPIYIQLILPVTTSFETSKIMNPYGLKNSDVPKFNDVLIDIAFECGVYYFDCSELFVLDNGSLNPEKSSDGAHLTLAAYSEQLDFYKTHVVKRP